MTFSCYECTNDSILNIGIQGWSPEGGGLSPPSTSVENYAKSITDFLNLFYYENGKEGGEGAWYIICSYHMHELGIFIGL